MYTYIVLGVLAQVRTKHPSPSRVTNYCAPKVLCRCIASIRLSMIRNSPGNTHTRLSTRSTGRPNATQRSVFQHLHRGDGTKASSSVNISSTIARADAGDAEV